MPLHVAQQASRRSTDSGTWDWKIWLEGSDAELDQVDWVRYQLHPTFPNPTHVVKNRAAKFALKSAGWGEFLIYVLVRLTSGEDVELNHWLDLSEGAAAGDARALRVFVSSSLSERPLANAVTDVLRAHEVQVVSGDDVSAGSSFSSALDDHLAQSDVALVFLGDSVSKWAQMEIQQLREHDVDIIPIAMNPQAAAMAGLGDRNVLYIKPGQPVDDVAERLLKLIPSAST